MTTSNRSATRSGEIRMHGVRHDPPDIGKIATVLLQLVRQQAADNLDARDNPAVHGDISSPLPPVPGSRPAPRRARQLDQDQIQTLIQHYIEGASTNELGGRFGVDRRTVSAVLHRYNIPIRRRGLTSTQVDEAIDLHGLGWSLARGARHLGADPVTVLNRLCDRGVRTSDTDGRTRP